MIETKFKHTEIGLIPHDWEVATLGELVTVHDGTHQTPHYVNVGVNFYSVENITNNEFSKTKFISEEEHALLTRKFKIERGDVLMTRIGSIGVCKYIDWDVRASFYVSLALLKNKDKDRLYMPFLAFASTTKEFKDSVSQNSLQFAIPLKINLGKISDITFPLPPTTAEQERIADALSKIDSLITDLDALVEKKRAIKTGTMQQLLTGKKRLKGFTGDWKEVKLGDIADIRTGKRNGDENVINGKYPFFVRSEVVYRINSFSYDGEAILIPGEGGIGKIFHYINGKFDFHQRVYKISHFPDELCAKFIYFYLRQFFGAYALQNTVKATVDSLRLPIFQEFVMCIPPTIDEQNAIASILSSMDTEIAALEQKRDKYIAIKQGMMQNLLTGKIRLV